MRVFLTFMMILFQSFSFAADKTLRGEYVLSSESLIDAAQVKDALRDFSPDIVRKKGKGHYLIRYKKDPGIKVLREEGRKKHFEIQPNLPYKAL